MAVVSSEIAAAVFELRSAALTLIAVVLKTTDLAARATELAERAGTLPSLFDDEPVVIDLDCVRSAEPALNFAELIGRAAMVRRVGDSLQVDALEQRA